MPCHPIISSFINIQIGLNFLVPSNPGCPGKEVVKWVPVYYVTLLVTEGGGLEGSNSLTAGSSLTSAEASFV